MMSQAGICTTWKQIDEKRPLPFKLVPNSNRISTKRGRYPK